MFAIPHSLIALAETLELRWKSYREGGDSDVFVEFTLSLNSLTEQLSQQHLPGLVRACQELENTALSLFGDKPMICVECTPPAPVNCHIILSFPLFLL